MLKLKTIITFFIYLLVFLLFVDYITILPLCQCHFPMGLNSNITKVAPIILEINNTFVEIANVLINDSNVITPQKQLFEYVSIPDIPLNSDLLQFSCDKLEFNSDNSDVIIYQNKIKKQLLNMVNINLEKK